MEHERHHVLDRRRAGVLLHPTSLPGSFDHGVLGADAHRFVDFLCSAGFTVWQTLPLGPVDATLLPYRVKSSRAGNPRLISLDLPDDVPWRPSAEALNGARDWESRRKLIRWAFDQFCRLAPHAERRRFASFIRSERAWLLPFALFEALKLRFDGRVWWEWPERLRNRDPEALRRARNEEREAIRRVAFEQFVFAAQWQALKRYANDRGVYLFGDLPIYIGLDSVDVWWQRELFLIDANGRPVRVAGVPPDYFSEDGQLWENPVYDWERMRSDGFRWWIDRVRSELNRFDLLRIDHFRALEAYWEVPGGATTARDGRWTAGPGADLLEALSKEVAMDRLVAEDLGTITPAVSALRDRFGLPGVLVLQFAFDGSPDNPFLPPNHRVHAVVYSGTHDNDTTLGWYTSLDNRTREFVNHQLRCRTDEMPGALIRAVLGSRAKLAIVPMQDVLELGSEHRMNTPGTTTGNWVWRFSREALTSSHVRRYRDLLESFGR